jgi:glycosyltransferase involved in cell wall biosynthesis
VAVVTYNHRPYIGQALDSVLRQRVPGDAEIVVGDDASTDGTRELLQDYQRRHPGRIRLLLHDHNGGDGGRRNYMATLAACRGDYVAYLDGDDFWLGEDKLARQASLLEQNPALSACAHPVRRLYDDGSEDLFAAAAQRAPFCLRDLTRNFTFLHCGSLMYRRAALGDLPDWFADSRVKLDDWALTLLCARRGNIGYLDEVRGVYRKHDQGIWSGQRAVRRLYWDLDCRAFVLGRLADEDGLESPADAGFRRALQTADTAMGADRRIATRWQLSLALLRFPFRRALSPTYYAMFLIELWAAFSKPLLLRLRKVWRG